MRDTAKYTNYFNLVNGLAIRLIFLILSLSSKAKCQSGHPHIEYLPPSSYASSGVEAGPQVYDLIKDSRGRLMVAGADRIIAWDGENWSLVEGTEGIFDMKLGLDSEGHVYAGGKGQLGRIIENEYGRLAFGSLTADLPATILDSINIYSVLTDGKGVLFQSTYHCFSWDGNSLRVNHAPRRWYRGFKVGDNILLHDSKRGLFNWNNGNPELLSDHLKGYLIKSILPLKDDVQREWIIVSKRKGIYTFSNNELNPLPGPVNSLLAGRSVFHAAMLPGKRIALAVLGNGLFIIDPEGNIELQWTEANGFPNDIVYKLWADPAGFLWCGTNNGIVVLESSNRLTLFDKQSGIKDNVTAIAEWGGTIQGGTISGVYQAVASDKGSEFFHNSRLEGFVHEFRMGTHSLVAATGLGLGQVTTDGTHLLSADVVVCLYPVSGGKDEYWAGSRNYIFKVRSEPGSLTILDSLPVSGKTIFDLIERPSGDLLAMTDAGDLITLSFPDNGLSDSEGNQEGSLPRSPDPIGVEVWDSTSGWNSNQTPAFFLDAFGKQLICSQAGLYSIEDGKVAPDNSLGAQLSRRPVDELLVLSDTRVVLYSNGSLGYADRSKDAQWVWDTIPFQPLRSTTVRSLFADSQGILWIGTDIGLYRYDQDAISNSGSPFNIVLSGITAGRDSTLPPNGESIDLSAALNDLRFDFSATYPQYREEIQYAYQLEGYDEDWSPWSERTHKEYTNLPGGDYTFRIKAKNLFGKEASSSGLKFHLNTPWHLQAWAFFLYGILILVLFWLVIRLRVRRLERAKTKLEGIVKERTAKIEAQKEQLQEEKLETEKQRDRAEASEASKQQFFANMTHELRTPMTLIIGPVDQMLRDKEKVTKRRLGQVQRNGKKLLRLINQLLDIAKVESERMELHLLDIDLIVHCREIVANFSGYAREQGIELSFLSDQDKLVTAFDPEKIEKVMYNLLSNAIKFTPSGGKVEVFVLLNEENTAVEVQVNDSGRGISEEDLPHVFDRFYQSSKVRSSDQGTGIGLALSKELVELHGGTIEVKSIEKIGTKFSFQLPVITTGREGEVSAGQTDSSDLYQVQEAERGPAINRPEESELIGETVQPLLLLVEDNADVRAYVRSCIPPEYRIMEAGNGKQGLELALEFIPDLVVADIMMPEMNGYEMTDYLKKNEKTSHVPIIQLTSLSERENRLEGLEIGADAYLTKPFDQKELEIRIRKLIEIRQSLKGKYRSEVLMNPAKVEATSMDEKFLIQLKESIHQHLGDEQFSVDALADEMGMSRVQLHRKFKALTGQTPGKFIRKYRLDIAHDLLEKKTATVAEIAFDCGFSSAAYFSKCFSDEFGETPSSVRNR